jgi:hypothetical protein
VLLRSPGWRSGARRAGVRLVASQRQAVPSSCVTFGTSVCTSAPLFHRWIAHRDLFSSCSRFAVHGYVHNPAIFYQ